MEQNKSLSARIRRRNAQGFNGVGTNPVWSKSTHCGDYRNTVQNHKDVDELNAQRQKNKVGFRKVILSNSMPFAVNRRALTKKFADNHQKLS